MLIKSTFYIEKIIILDPQIKSISTTDVHPPFILCLKVANYIYYIFYVTQSCYFTDLNNTYHSFLLNDF